MSPETTNVFIDTEVFDRHKLDFNSPQMRRIIRLATANEMKLILTDVTIGEIKSHINKTAAASASQLSQLRRINRVVRDVIGEEKLSEMSAFTEDVLTSRLKENLNKFLTETKAEVVTIDDARPSDVFRKYFHTQAPFSSGKKKSEFSDAFAGAALEAWCKEASEEKLFIVSGDDDWKQLCDTTDPFIYVNKLDELLEKFADSEAVTYVQELLQDESDVLIARLKEKIDEGSVYFYLDDSIVDGEVDEVENVDIDIDGHVIVAEDGKATLGLFCRVQVTLSVSGMDSDSMWRDPDTGSIHSVWIARGSVEREIEMEATVQISYDQKTPDKITINDISFQDDGVCVGVDESELSTDYDLEDHYEYDPEWEPEVGE